MDKGHKGRSSETNVDKMVQAEMSNDNNTEY